MLAELQDPVAEECARFLAGDTTLRDIVAGLASPATLASTLATKYTMAREKGHRVEGLESVLDSLRRVDPGVRVGMAHIPGTADDYFTLILNDEFDKALSILHAIPEDKGS